MEYGYFRIKAKLPSLNDYIKACRSNKYQGAEFKREVEEMIGWSIKNAVAARTLKKITKPCRVHFHWYEKTRKRDCDNIASAKKYILDALQKEGILQGDGQKYVRGFTDSFAHDDTDWVLVSIEEITNED